MEKVDAIIELIKNSKHAVVFTGAGMSTESGLKDFRSAGGLWAGKNPREIASTKAIKPQGIDEGRLDYLYRANMFAEFYKWRIREVLKFRPNKGHRVLADWQAMGAVGHIVTQNVDGYHQQMYPHGIIPLHGDILKLRCNTCFCRHGHESYAYGDHIFCDNCPEAGVIRPNIVLFGEGLGNSYLEAEEVCKNADLCIVLGSSLLVSPANALPLKTVANGGNLVIVNLEPTPLDSFATVVINGREIGDVLVSINSKLDSV